MIRFETHISDLIFEFFQRNQKSLLDFTRVNSIIKEVSGINDFFTTQEQADELLGKTKEHNSIVSEPDRREYGDYQTNQFLAQKVVDYALSKSNDFEFVLEPTCGKGNFLLATIKKFKKGRWCRNISTLRLGD